MLVYVLVEKPPMYDGFRHFLFSIPPVFAIIGFVFQFLYEKASAFASHYAIYHPVAQRSGRNTILI
jgi:hypothetical protein